MSPLGVLRLIGQGLSYLLLGLLLLVSLGLGVGYILDQTAPVVWGTYTEHRCEAKARGGCTSIGTWVSDDRELTRTEVHLDGRPGPDGTVRAGYRPQGLLSAGQNVVHVEFWIDAGPIASFVLAAWIGFLIVRQAARWGHLPKRRRPRKRSGGGVMAGGTTHSATG